ncbi:MAG: WD40 repeat domain-containing protein, partial [Candidatus Kariarchaeaceae archaeon]
MLVSGHGPPYNDPPQVGKIKFWNYQTGNLTNILTGHTDAVRYLSFHSQNESIIISSSYDNTVFFWDIRDGSIINIINTHINPAYPAYLEKSVLGWTKITPNGELLITITRDNRLSRDYVVQIWDLGLNSNIKNITFSRIKVESYPDLSPDGTIFASPVDGGTINLWNLANIPNDNDNDGMDDFWEIGFNLNTSDFSDKFSDSDQDGLMNGMEYFIDTSPTEFDTDDDLMDDGWEYKNKLNASLYDAFADFDNDEMTNLWE